MNQNTSSAVMQQRREPHQSLDDFPTPPWATRALCDWLMLGYFPRPKMPGGLVHCDEVFPRDAPDVTLLTCREPAANRGHMVRPLREYFAHVDASDIHDYGAGFPVRDYLFGPDPATVGWTITNPPFRLAEQFIQRALRTSDSGVAMLTRTAFLEGGGRWRSLFSQTPPTHILQFTERVVMHKGRLVPKGSTATAYCWLVWDKSADAMALHDTKFDWIPPCRKQLERAEDYA